MNNKTDKAGVEEYTFKKHQKFIFMFELLGTFLFTYAIGCSHQKTFQDSSNFIHCISILLPLALAGQVSGGYFNSTVTLAAFVNKKHKILKLYLSAQFLGGLMGTVWCWLITDRMIAGYQHQHDKPIQLTKFIINQFVGSFLFSVCVMVLTNKFTTHVYKSWQIYISIAASLYLIRKLIFVLFRMSDDTPINPNVSIFYQIGAWIKSGNAIYLQYLWILIVPSTVGGVLGGLFMYRIYEPLLLYVKFKNYDFDNDCQIIEKTSQTSDKQS